MTFMRRHIVLLIVYVPLFLIGFGACGTDSPPDDTPPEERPPEKDREPNPSTPIDYKPGDKITIQPLRADDPREIIPCTGDLCYDVTDPEIVDRIDHFWTSFYGITEEELLWDENYPLLMEALQARSDRYAACNYVKVSGDLIEVTCPEWVEFTRGCPGHFHDFDEPDIVDVRNDGHKHYCLSKPSARNHIQLTCPNGYVNSGELSVDWADFGFTLPSCLDSALCKAVLDREGIPGDDVCFYGDFTTVQTGIIPEQDCAGLAPGTCAINCSCPSMGIVPRDNTCQYLSEDHPVGLCGYSRCRQLDADPSCAFPDTACVLPEWPAWTDTVRAEGPFSTTRPGVCVHKETCDTWSAANPGVVTCGTPAEVP